MAELTHGRVGQRQTNGVLGALADGGIVLREHRPPAKLYRLNREHVAAAGIIALAGQWRSLLQRIEDEVATWELAPVSACLFGSAARGDANAGSDIDILLVPRDEVAASDARQSTWNEQVDRLSERVETWSGNSCEILELTRTELGDAAARDDRLARDLRTEAISLAGKDVRGLLRAGATK